MQITRKMSFQHVPEYECQPSRRRFLKHMLGGVAATTVLPAIGFGETRDLSDPLTGGIPALPAGTVADERFWELVKEQFPLRPGLILMNAANLCPAPYPVIDTVFGLTRDIDSDASFQNRAKFRDLHEQALQALAEYLGADADELVIDRNTSEGNNMVINGLDLKPGDEVVIWDQNHPTNNVAWDVRAERLGFLVRRVSTPKAPKTPEELVKPFAESLNKKTKVLAFSHISNISGVALPAKEICRMARNRGIFTLIDGAQCVGFMQLDLHDVGCDFYTASSHKWLMGPKEAGVLYVRKDRVDQLWPSVVGVGWEQAREKGARKFGTLGQRDDATVAAMGKAVAFHNSIGRERVEARVRELAAALKHEIQRKIPSAEFHTPWEPEMSGGVVVFALQNVDLRKVFTALYTDHNIGCATMRGDFAGIRLCPHVYNTMEEVDRVVAAIASLV